MKDATARSAPRSPAAFAEFPAVACAHAIQHRFGQQAARRPDAPAIALPSGDISYGALNAAADRTARRLRAVAGTATRPVALLLDQGAESIVWTLAVLKAGLCFAPLDQRLPEPVLKRMLDDLGPAALIVGAHAAAATIVFVDVLPLTNDLKVDRQRLPQPARERPSLANDYVAPRTETERQLAGVWSDVLEIDRIGVTDSYFDLGGDSLRAARIVARLADAYGSGVRIASLFEHSTIAALAGALPATIAKG